MPNLFLAAMVRELSSSTGTGAFVLDGAAPGHRAFASVVPPAATFPYAICGVSDESQWETGEGTLSPTGALLRTPKASSAGGALVNFGAGLKTVALTLTANWAGAVAAEAAAPVALAAVTGLTQALAGKQNQLSASPSTSVIAAQDGIAITRNGQSLNATGGAVLARRTADGPYVAEGDLMVTGKITGGFGAQGGAGAADWNDVSNATSGTGPRLMKSTDANCPPRGTNFHPFTFEYSTKNGTGTMTQFAVPYYDGSNFYGMRFRASGVWTGWRAILYENNSGNFLPGADNANALGAASVRFSTIYAASGSINTSDERQKTDIGAIPDEWLDAWGDVAWSRYRFKDGRRWHVGLVAQRVHAAFAARGLDAFTIGLCCYDQWDAERAPVLDDQGNVTGEGDVMTEAGDLWGLRYDECFAMEAAWVRRELSRLQAGKSDKRSHRRVA